MNHIFLVDKIFITLEEEGLALKLSSNKNKFVWEEGQQSAFFEYFSAHSYYHEHVPL